MLGPASTRASFGAPRVSRQAQLCLRRFSSSPVSAAALGKSAVVTGSSRGIGKAVALRLARDGFNITINDVPSNGEGIAEVVDQIRAMGRQAIPAPADVTNVREVNDMIKRTVDELGPLSTMVANAGVVQVKPLMDITPEDNKFIFDVNYLGVFNCYQAAARQFVAQGKPPAHPPVDSGIGAKPVGSSGVYKLIAASSIAAMGPFPLIGPYCASKWAVRGLNQAFAKELAPFGITSNCYAPGIVGTKMWDELDEQLAVYFKKEKGEVREGEARRAALGRVSVPEDVCGLVSYLASGDSDYMTGQCLAVDGGIAFT